MMGVRGKGLLVLLLALYLALGIAFSVIVPLWEAPDELRHFVYAKYLADNSSLPPVSYELSENPVTLAFHPPLYHMLVAPLACGYSEENPQNGVRRAAGDGKRVYTYSVQGSRFPYHGIPLRAHLIRLVSLIMGTVVVVCAWRIGGLAFPAERWLPFVAASVVALNPQFIFIQASINDQALSSALGALLLLLITRAIIGGITPVLALALGFLMGATLLTATLGVLFIPVVIAGLFASGVGARKALLYSVNILVIAAAVAGWWYLRNQLLFDDPFLWKIHREVFGKPFLRESPMGTIEFLNLLRLLHRSFWGVFGSMNIPLPAAIYWTLEIFTSLCIVGFILCVARGKQVFERSQLRILLVLSFTVLLFFFAILRYNFTFISVQGRYLFIVFPAIAVPGAIGLIKGVNKSPALLGAAVFVLLFALASGALLFFVWPAYTNFPS